MNLREIQKIGQTYEEMVIESSQGSYNIRLGETNQ